MAKALKTAALVVGVVSATVLTYGAFAAAAAGTAGAAAGTAAGAGAAAAGAGAAAAGTALATGTAASASVLGLSMATWGAISAVSSIAFAGLTALTMPGITAQGNQTEYRLDPNAPIPYVIGRTYNAGSPVYRRDHTSPGDVPNDRLTDVVVFSGGGPVDAIEQLYMDKQPITFNASGQAVGDYNGYLWAKYQLGATPETSALAVTSGDGSPPPAWGSANKLSGYAAAIFTARFDSKGKRFPNGEPSYGAVLRGAKVYDPRQDDTYPGGSGSCRALQENTYVYSENPYLHALTWLLGRWQNGKRIIGVGIPISLIDVPAFVNGANVADANGWKVGGVIYSTDGKWETLKRILQAGAGLPITTGAHVSCLVSAPVVSLDTVTMDDVVGDVEVTATRGRTDRINSVTPRYRSPAHDWEIVSDEPIEVAAHIAEDNGEIRAIEYDIAFCQDADQAAQLGRYQIENSREFGPITLTLKPRWLGYKPGDAVTLDLPQLGLTNRLAVITDREFSADARTVTLTLRSETTEKHAFALGQTATPPPIPSVAAPPLVPVPLAEEWDVAATELKDGDVTKPAIVLTGAATVADPDFIITEIREWPNDLAADQGWVKTGMDSGDMTEKYIVSVLPNRQYQVAISYKQRGQTGDRLILGPVMTGEDSAISIALAARQIAEDAEAIADGKIETFYQDAAPSAAVSSIGDLWIDTNDGNKLYRFNGSVWVSVQDNGISAAITAAAGAQATADGKVTTFYSNTPPVAEAVGDLWAHSTTGYVKRWNGSAWVDVSNIGATPEQIEDINAALSAAQAAQQAAQNAESIADGKIATYYQSNPPASPPADIGDLWFDTNDGNRQYTFQGLGLFIAGQEITIAGTRIDIPWVTVEDTRIGDALTAAAGAQATADGKITTFYSETTPTAEALGDLWYQPSTEILRRWNGSAWAETASLGAPPGTNVGGQPAENVAAAAVNFNRRNDRNGAAIPNPTIATNGTAVDHVINTDGSADISLEWSWSGDNADIDGFAIYMYASTSSGAYTIGTNPAAEQMFFCSAEKRAFLFFGCAADKYYTFGVRAYRVVDPDVNSSGVIQTPIIQPTRAEERPYRPTNSVAFAGDITGTISGTAASVIVGKTQNLTPGGMLNPVIGIDTGVLRTLGRDISIVRLRDGETFVFPADWGTNTPAVVGMMNGMISSTEFIETAAINITSAGFTARCKKVTAVSGVETQITANATASSPRIYEKVKANNDIAFGDRFTFHFDVNVVNRKLTAGEYEPGSITLGFWTYDGSSWQMNGTATYGGDATQDAMYWPGSKISLVRPNMGNGSRFGISIVSNRYGGGVTAFHSVSYNAVSSVTETTATPNGFPGMDFLIVGGGKVEG